MPDVYCSHCGTKAQPADLFCRICGASLNIPAARLEPVGTDRSPRRTPAPALTVLAILVACFFLLTVILAGFYIVSLPDQSNGRPALAFEIVGTSTPYPTRRPYSTAFAYKTSTAYPTDIPYPTTGPLATLVPTPTPTQEGSSQYIAPYQPPSIPDIYSTNRCELIVKNQFSGLDSVVVLARVDTKAAVKVLFVRANDTFTTLGIPAGTYDTFIELGQDWDALNGRFINNSSYHRIADPVTFKSCSFSVSGGYDYWTVTLNYVEGPGVDSVIVPPGDFPRLSP